MKFDFVQVELRKLLNLRSSAVFLVRVDVEVQLFKTKAVHISALELFDGS